MLKVEIKLETGTHANSRSDISDYLVMTYDQRKKGRIRVTGESGKDYGLFLERGKVLADGDLLEAENGERLAIKAKEEELNEGRCDDWETFAKACYHLGNRHVPVAIGDRVLHIQSDYILRDMLIQLGMQVRDCEGPFMPEQGAYSGGHHHHHDDDDHHNHSHENGHSHANGHSHD